MSSIPNDPILHMQLPSGRDGCPVQSRVLALEGRMDALTDEVRTLSSEVESLSLELRATVDRSKALNIEMGTQLQRYAEYTSRNMEQDKRGRALEQRLADLIEVLRVTAGGGKGRGRARKT